MIDKGDIKNFENDLEFFWNFTTLDERVQINAKPKLIR